MSGNKLLSVILTTHAQPEHLESLLDALLDFRIPDSEIIIINDNAEKPHARALQLLIDMYTGDDIIYIKHHAKHGRSQSLNEALLIATGTLIWAPLRADRLNKKLLRENLKKMANDPSAFWVLDRSLPVNFHIWLKEIEEGTLPNDNRFIFNRSIIPSSQLYFREEMGQKAAAELAYRLLKKKSYQSTDSFFVIDRTPFPPPKPANVQEFIFTMLRETEEPEERRILSEKLKKLDFSKKIEQSKTSILDEARAMMEEDARVALDLINEHIKIYPGHYEALKLKVTILEKLRRHVEASELKHDIQKKEHLRIEKNDYAEQPTLFGPDKKEKTKPRVAEKDIHLSIIIPTTGDCKHILEECLVHLDKLCDSMTTELIVVDNASIDDTFDYLAQLQDKNFLNIEVLTNKVNAGFGPSINRGIEAARGKYLLFMHNDLFPNEGAIEEMASLLDENKFLGAVGPVIDKCDLDRQMAENVDDSTRYIKVREIDSCCMLYRASCGVKFDDLFKPAFYDDVDFCKKLAEKGYNVAIATRALARHEHRVTTEAMGLHLEPELRWRNSDRFYNKWGDHKELKIPQEGDITDILRRILIPTDPLNPPRYWRDKVTSLFTDEVKTDLLKRQLDEEDLYILIKVLIIIDKRDFLRQMETKIEKSDIPRDLLRFLIRYYYRRNIYSRCRLYLKKNSTAGPFFDLYRLRIAVAEKEPDIAVKYLNRLMESYPCHPDLYRLAGEIHRMGGNEGEAKSFFALADQLDPKENIQDKNNFVLKY